MAFAFFLFLILDIEIPHKRQFSVLLSLMGDSIPVSVRFACYFAGRTADTDVMFMPLLMSPFLATTL
jgi:hypothetical protein